MKVKSLSTVLLVAVCLIATVVVMLIRSHFLHCTICDTVKKSLLAVDAVDDRLPGQDVEEDSRISEDKNHEKNRTFIGEKNGSEVLNPGCREKKRLSDYRAVDTGKVYNHPSIVHYAKLNRNGDHAPQLNFREYTSVLSVRKFLQPEKIMFHTYSNTLSGKYWDMINSWKDVSIEVNKLPRLQTIGGKHVSYIQHEADYIKLKSVYNYGGLALDFDVIIVNGTRLKHEQSLSECVLSEEGEYINGGFYSCIKNSPYMARWINSYDTDYRPHLWIHNVSYKPKDFLLDKKSDVCYNVHLDDTICVHPNAGKQKREWLQKGGVNWRTKTAAHYFVKENIAHDGEGLLKESHSLGDLLRYVRDA